MATIEALFGQLIGKLLDVPADRKSVNVQAGKIRILGGTLTGKEVPVSARVILGRDPSKAQIVFPSEDTAVSRLHCEIRFDRADGHFEVRDLGSRNGTFIANGSDPPRRLAPDVAERLPAGQNILVGSRRNRLVLELDRDVQRQSDASENVQAGKIPILGGSLPGGETAMLTLLVSVAIALVGIIVVFFALSLVGLDKSVAGPIATAIVGGIPYLRDTLDKEGLLRARRTGGTVLSFDGLGLPPQRLILNGTLILFAAMNLSSVFGAVVVGGSGLEFAKAVGVIQAVSAAVVAPTMFLVGRWVGRRSVSKGIAVIFLICVIARTTATLIDLTLLSTQEFAATYREMTFLQQILFGTALLFAVGCWGYWRGRRQRLAAYLTYLLGRVPTDTLEAIVKLAFVQASRKGVT
jgi:hypothetical protein